MFCVTWQEELVFAEEGGNGSGGVQQIVYRSAVPVTPDALDALCDKVHAQPCFLVKQMSGTISACLCELTWGAIAPLQKHSSGPRRQIRACVC